MATVDIGSDEYIPTGEFARAPANWFVPGWVWFSIPMAPMGPAEASHLLGFDCENRLYLWLDKEKEFRLYPSDFTDLAVGLSYVLLLKVGEEHAPIYEATLPGHPYERLLPSAGWCTVGLPSSDDLAGMALSVKKNDVTRTAAEDLGAPDPWLNWNWIYWNPVAREARIMNPFGGGDDTMLHPWYGYRVWSNTENVTIVFP